MTKVTEKDGYIIIKVPSPLGLHYPTDAVLLLSFFFKEEVPTGPKLDFGIYLKILFRKNNSLTSNLTMG